MYTRSQRLDLVHNVVADTMHTFMYPKYRGINWTVESMPGCIESFIKIAMLSNAIPERHLKQMQEDALTFYNRHFNNLLMELVRLQELEKSCLSREPSQNYTP